MMVRPLGLALVGAVALALVGTAGAVSIAELEAEPAYAEAMKDVVAFVDETLGEEAHDYEEPDAEGGAQESLAKRVAKAKAKDTGADIAPSYTFAGTLQHVANRFCTEIQKRRGKGKIFCNELIALQHSWLSAQSKGSVEKFTGFIGHMSGHYCPDQKAYNDPRCLVLSLLNKAIPANLKWNIERRRYMQLTRDVAKHFCDTHGDHELFCPLLKGLDHHFFMAVRTGESKDYLKYLDNLNNHYCAKGRSVNHPADARCSVFPLLKDALPSLSQTGTHQSGEVIENGGAGRHVTPGSPPGDVPPLDSDMAGAADIELKKENGEKALAKEGEQKAGIKKKRQSKKFSVYDDGKSSDDVPH